MILIHIWILYSLLSTYYSQRTNEDDEYEKKLGEWQCRLKYPTPREQVSHSFGYCFKEPSNYCRQHAVSMNGCKRYKNMGLYCCLMQSVEQQLYNYKLPSWMSKQKFLRITAPRQRHNHIFNFFAMDIEVANITSAEEMSAFLAIVMLDTHFLLNMEEHLPDHIATQHWKYRYLDHVKYIGRGAIHVKGKDFYQWINMQLRNLQLNQSDDKTLLDVHKYPEILLFPTAAFRAAGLIWKYSYSVVENGTKSGKTFKELADGDVDDLTQILYNLKGNIQRLPELLTIWRRIRLVMDVPNKIPKKKIKSFGPHQRCEYETLCRSTVYSDVKCPKFGHVQQVSCSDCSRPLHIYMIIKPSVFNNETLRKSLKNLIEDISEKTQASVITFVQNLDHGVENDRHQSFIIVKAEELETFLKTLPKSTPIIEIPAIINATLQKPTSDINKKAIIVVTDTLDVKTFDGNLQNAIFQAENARSVNTYVMYYQHNKTLQRSLPEHIQSRMYHIDSREITEALCNDPEIVTFTHQKHVYMGKNEKRAFILRLNDTHRKVLVDIHIRKGNITLIQVEKQIWKIPFDETMEFDKEHNVRDSLNIRDNYTRFKGEDVEIEITEIAAQIKSTTYRSPSLEVLLVFKGVDPINEMVIKVITETILVPEIPPVSVFVMAGQCAFWYPCHLFPDLQHFQTSCYVFVCILLVACLFYSFYLIDIVAKFKHQLKPSNDKFEVNNRFTDTQRTSCEQCFRQLNNDDSKEDDDDEYSKLFYRDNMGYQGHTNDSIRKKTRFMEQRKQTKKCRACIQRLDMLVVSRLHFVRLLLLIIFELLLALVVWKHIPGMQCRVLSGACTFLINLILIICLTEMLCYTGLKETAGNKLWWPGVVVYCLILSIATEYARPLGEDLKNCWPITDDLQGRIVLTSTILIALVLLLFSLYYFLLNGRECVTQTGYTMTLVLVVMLLILVISLVENVLKENETFIMAFICINTILAIVILLFTLVVQAKTQDWKLAKYLNVRKVINNSEGTEMNRRGPSPQIAPKTKNFQHHLQPVLINTHETWKEQVPEKTCFSRTGSQRESFKRKEGSGSTGQPIKTISLVPANIDNNRIDDMEHSPMSYTLDTIFCQSMTSLEPEPPASYDDAFEIIVRTKRPRSVTGNNATRFLDASSNSNSQHQSAELYPSQELQNEDTVSRDSFDISKFVTSLPPVISFHHSTTDANANETMNEIPLGADNRPGSSLKVDDA